MLLEMVETAFSMLSRQVEELKTLMDAPIRDHEQIANKAAAINDTYIGLLEFAVEEVEKEAASTPPQERFVAAPGGLENAETFGSDNIDHSKPGELPDVIEYRRWLE